MTTDLSREVYLARSSRYANPRRGGDCLPWVYGDLTQGGQGGVWTCPCIDTENHVYCAAGHEILSLANGNSITVYDKDMQEIDGGGYTFDEASAYESQGVIATLTFSEDVSAVEPISLRGKGKNDGASLIDNPMDIVEDILNRAGLNSLEWDETSKTRATNYLAGLPLTAAGVIDRDFRPDCLTSEILSGMVSWWRGGEGTLLFHPHLAPGVLCNSDVAAHFKTSDFDPGQVTLDFNAGDICTRAAVNYAYNWAKGDFEEFEDGQAEAAADYEARYRAVMARSFDLPWIRTEIQVRLIQALIVGFYKSAPAILNASLKGLRAALLERGDIIGVSLRWFYDDNLDPLVNQMFRLISVTPDFDRNEVSIEALNTGACLVDENGTRDTNEYA